MTILIRGSSMPGQAIMQPSRAHCPSLRPNALQSWQRLCICLCTLFLTLSLLISLVDVEIVYARHAPNRRDRRPDRETRIRYPRSRSQNNSNQGSNSALQSAPPADTPSPSTSNDDPAPSTTGQSTNDANP